MKRIWEKLPPLFKDFLIAYFPKKIAKALYGIPLSILKRETAGHKELKDVQVWPRHSFVSGAFTPFVSDLDITFWVEGEFSESAAQELGRAVEAANSFLPVIRETNLYRLDDGDWMFPCFNPFELDRDPYLKKKIGTGRCPGKNQITAAVFLFRMLDSDFKNLVTMPGRRRKKWLGHFSAVAEGLGQNLKLEWSAQDGNGVLENILRAVVGLCGLSQENEIRCMQDLLSYFKLREQGVDVKTYPSHKYLWVWCPHVLIYQPCVFDAVGLGRLESEILLAQIQWEIWGLGTQYVLKRDKDNFLNHLKGLKQVLSIILAVDRENIATRALADRLEKLYTCIEALRNPSLSRSQSSQNPPNSGNVFLKSTSRRRSYSEK